MKYKKLRSTRGSALLTAMVMTVAIGLVLVSQLSLTQSTLKVSNRGFYTNAALGLAETGLEHALWSLNAAGKGTAGAWDGWTVNSGNATRKFTSFDYDEAATGEVSVHVSDYAGENPQIVAKSLITLHGGSQSVEKWLKISVANGVAPSTPDRSRSLFAYGLLARESIYANGGAWMDSWLSDPDENPDTPSVPWSMGVSRSNARVAVQSTSPGAMWIDGADVYGTAAVGAPNNSGLTMKAWDGQIGPRGASYTGSYRVTPGALSVDFAATYETVVEPTGGTVRPPYVLPRSELLQVSNQWSSWFQNVYVSTDSIGTTGASTSLQMDKLTVEGAATLTIKGHVTLYLPPAASETVKIAGSGKILLENGATLTIYTPGSITVSGAGIANSGSPSAVQIWSTRNGSIGQKISLQGSGALNAVVYAPDAELTLPGHTDFCGAAVVRVAKLTGSGAFHYDESLEFFVGNAGAEEEASGGATGVGGTVSIETFEELNTPGSRQPYLAALGF